MKQIPLSQNKTALVDDCDYDNLIGYKWFAKRDEQANTWYAIRLTPRPNRRTILMHRVIMNATSFTDYIDHIDHDGLNNVRSNLRHCNNSFNQGNRGKRKNKSSIYKGVTWFKDRRNWKASIMKNRKAKCLGYYTNEIDAAIAYNTAAKELFGDYALLNPIPSETTQHIFCRASEF